MKECRIIRREFPGHNDQYVIQQKHFIFRWQWVDAWINSVDGAACQDTFSTLEDARNHLKYFDGTKHIDTVVQIRHGK